MPALRGFVLEHRLQDSGGAALKGLSRDGLYAKIAAAWQLLTGETAPAPDAWMTPNSATRLDTQLVPSALDSTLTPSAPEPLSPQPSILLHVLETSTLGTQPSTLNHEPSTTIKHQSCSIPGP